MADRSRLSRQAVDQLKLDGLDVFDTVIRSSVCVGESSYTRVPLYEYAPRSGAAQDYEALYREVLGDG
jgi:cellulose biosynthesis protein BcsQ